MPELPEVETIKSDLDSKLKGRRILKIKIKDLRVIKYPSPDVFRKKLKGDTFLNVQRRGKFLILNLKSGNTLLIHLGIAGWLEYLKEKDLEYSRIIFELDNGWKLFYADTRLFGKVRLFSEKELKSFPPFQKLGPEPLSKNFSLEWFKKALSKHRVKIKPLLLNQNFIAGIGNIYAQESLFLAGIHPERKANRLKEKEIEKLYQAIKKVLNEAIRYRGTSVNTYVDTSGEEGSFQYRLKVYDREGEPCFRCKAPIKRRVIAQRGTYFCPRCQK